jgi:Mn-containing catalase
MHLKPLKNDRRAAHADPLIAIAGGGGVSLFNSMGDAWTADYLKITGELGVDLRRISRRKPARKSCRNG